MDEKRMKWEERREKKMRNEIMKIYKIKRYKKKRKYR